MMPKLYQKLYTDKSLRYGSAKHNRCPGVRYLPLYRHWLKKSVMDLGCGTGDTVHALRDLGFLAHGIDQVQLHNGMEVGDITKPIDLMLYDSAICMDVLEHLDSAGIRGVLSNLQQTEKQAITVHCSSARENGYDVELHITQMPVNGWASNISRYLKIRSMETLSPNRYLFLTESH